MQNIKDNSWLTMADAEVSPCMTGAGPADLSRRGFALAMSAAACSGAMPNRSAVMAPAAPVAAADLAVPQCERWLAISAEIEQLQSSWARIEDWLAREHAWFQLGPTEQETSPWAGKLREIEARLETLYAARDALLERLPACGSPWIHSIAARLSVAARLISPCDDPKAHGLIAGALQDLKAIEGAP